MPGFRFALTFAKTAVASLFAVIDSRHVGRPPRHAPVQRVKRHPPAATAWREIERYEVTGNRHWRWQSDAATEVKTLPLPRTPTARR